MDHLVPLNVSEERVLLDLGWTILAKSLVRELMSQPQDQVFKLLTEVVGYFQVLEANVISHYFDILVLKWRIARHELVHDDAERPPVR